MATPVGTRVGFDLSDVPRTCTGIADPPQEYAGYAPGMCRFTAAGNSRAVSREVDSLFREGEK